MENKMVKQAQQIIDIEILKEAVESLRPYGPIVAQMAMDIYKSFIAAGFNETQSFEFAKDYTLKIILNKQ